ncbi:MAG: galactokinase, partial [Microgenomates group bacterium]
MLIVRAPFRIPLGGGGTDLPSYYEKFEGELVSVAINKYMYISLNRPIVDKLIRVRYSESEKVDSVNKVKHDLVREALKLTGVTERVEIHSIADLPSGSGMGSSGSYLVALLKALYTLKREAAATERIAEEACEIEIDKLKRAVGKQDQYLAAFGGLTALKINKNGEVKVTRLDLPPDKLREIENSLVIFYTGVRRQASDILEHQKRAVKNKDKEVTENLHQIKAIGVDILKALKRGDVSALG